MLLDHVFPGDEPKRERLINACIKEFAAHGYGTASTNDIVKNAGVSKGILFHYFSTKQQLYIQIFEYCCEVCMNEYLHTFHLDNPDYIDRLYNLFLDKMVLLTRYPDIILFMESALRETDAAIQSLVVKKTRELAEQGYAHIFDGCDVTLFKENIDVTRALAIIRWTLDGLADSYRKKAGKSPGSLVARYPEIIEETEYYLNIFRVSFYKET